MPLGLYQEGKSVVGRLSVSLSHVTLNPVAVIFPVDKLLGFPGGYKKSNS